MLDHGVDQRKYAEQHQRGDRRQREDDRVLLAFAHRAAQRPRAEHEAAEAERKRREEDAEKERQLAAEEARKAEKARKAEVDLSETTQQLAAIKKEYAQTETALEDKITIEKATKNLEKAWGKNRFDADCNRRGGRNEGF